MIQPVHPRIYLLEGNNRLGWDGVNIVWIPEEGWLGVKLSNILHGFQVTPMIAFALGPRHEPG